MYKKIEIDGIDTHMAKVAYADVSEALRGVSSIDVNLLETLEGPDETGITLEMSEEVDNLIRSGAFPFTLEKHLEGYFGESTGSANVTTVKQVEEMNIEEVIHILEETGQIERALEITESFREESDPDAETILAYALGQYAKGWLAEEIVAATDWFSKGSVSQDQGGIDGYVGSDEVQLGSITRWNSKKAEIEASDRRHLLYQWGADGTLHVADAGDEALQMNKKVAKQDGRSATLIRRRHDGLKVNEEVGRGFRYLWW